MTALTTGQPAVAISRKLGVKFDHRLDWRRTFCDWGRAMKRIATSAGLLAATMVMLGPDLQACGDKSLSAGGIRMQRAMAARYPAAILLYQPANSPLTGAAQDLNLQQMLQRVGHAYHEVTSWAELQTSVESGRFNLVLADVGDVADLQQKLQSSPSRVIIVPVAHKMTKAEIKDISKRSRFLIKAPSRPEVYLRTIVDAVRSGSSTSRKG